MTFATFIRSAILLGATALAGSWAASAHAQLSEPYTLLLIEADQRQDAAGFAETADMVAAVAAGGRADVRMAVETHLPHRLEAVAGWPVPQVPGAADTAPGMMAEAASADVAPQQAPDQPGWFGQSLDVLQTDAWDGQVRFGVQLERGSTNLSDYAFALELDREFDRGWSLDSQVEYFYTDSDDVVTRDSWLTDLRLSRQLVSGIGYYAGGSYERDNVAFYQSTASLTGGGLWQVLDGEALSWSLRSGVGQRYRDPADGSATETDWVVEAGSEFSWQLSETTRFASETVALLGGGSSLDQRFSLTTSIAGNWAVQTDLRLEHEFETPAGVEATDTRLGLSLLRAF
ncbi:DUF481 domain-containing protein [Maricaulis sp. CAU 1757]